MHPGSPDAWVNDRDPLIEAQIDQFSVLFPFPLDEFQRDAIRILLNGDSVMVAAPTGTGKTVVAEFGVYQSFKRARSRHLHDADQGALQSKVPRPSGNLRR